MENKTAEILFAENLMKSYQKDAKTFEPEVLAFFTAINTTTINEVKRDKSISENEVKTFLVKFEPILQALLLTYYQNTLIPNYKNYDTRKTKLSFRKDITTPTQYIDLLTSNAITQAGLIQNTTITRYFDIITKSRDIFNPLRFITGIDAIKNYITEQNYLSSLFKNNKIRLNLLDNAEQKQDYITTLENKAIKSNLDATSKQRSKTISATETAIVGEAIRLLSAQERKLTKKTWIHTYIGLNPRDAHQRYSGTTIGINEKFSINGYTADAPRQFGVAKEDVNCQCIALYS